MRYHQFCFLCAALLLVQGAGHPGPILALEPGGTPPPVWYAPAPDHAQCRARLQRELPPSAAPYHEDYRCKMDFAQLEHEHPLMPADRLLITPDNITAADQEQIDQIYARLTAGPLPEGEYAIALFRPKEFGLFRLLAENLTAEGANLKGLARLLGSLSLEEFRQIWRTKIFDRGRRSVWTKVDYPAVLQKLLLGGNAGAPGLPQEASAGALLFPAKVYCGQSLLDGRRESIVIDYAFGDQLEGYRKDVDWIMGGGGLQVRDEIRTVRPGFYLGRVYVGRIFAANLTLYRQPGADQEMEAFSRTGRVQEDCEIGTQRLAASTR